MTLITGRAPAVFGGLLALRDAGDVVQFASQRIVALSGQLLLSPDDAQRRRLAASEANAFRQMLSRHASSVGAIWSADVKQGALEAQIATKADAWDITIIGHRRLHRRRGAVILLSSAADAETHAAQVAQHIADKLDTFLESIAEPLEDTNTILDRINRTNALALVLDADTAGIGVARMLELLSVARCPVIVLKSRNILPRLQHLVHIPPAMEDR